MVWVRVEVRGWFGGKHPSIVTVTVTVTVTIRIRIGIRPTVPPHQ